MEALNRRDFHQHLAMQEFCPPNEILTNGCYPDVSGSVRVLGDQGGKGSGAPKEEVFLNLVSMFEVCLIFVSHPRKQSSNTFLKEQGMALVWAAV